MHLPLVVQQLLLLVVHLLQLWQPLLLVQLLHLPLPLQPQQQQLYQPLPLQLLLQQTCLLQLFLQLPKLLYQRQLFRQLLLLLLQLFRQLLDLPLLLLQQLVPQYMLPHKQVRVLALVQMVLLVQVVP